jgi:hypothetical protein
MWVILLTLSRRIFELLSMSITLGIIFFAPSVSTVCEEFHDHCRLRGQVSISTIATNAKSTRRVGAAFSCGILPGLLSHQSA